MNRLILKHGRLVTAVILVVFAVVVYRRAAHGWGNDTILGVAAAAVWAIATPAFIYFWPRITVGGFKRAILKHGLGGGPIPVNTLYAEPGISSESAGSGGLMAAGTDDVLYVMGWLELRGGPQVLHVPEMAGRYYCVQLTAASTSTNFAYVGKRATGTKAGEYVIAGPGWKGAVPSGATRISSPDRSVLVVGRVFVAGDADRAAALALAQEIQLAPLGQ
jgi:hypothetical protein